MNVADILERAANLIEPEGAWCQGIYEDGGCQYCLAGAALHVGGWDYIDHEEPLFAPGVLGFKTWPEAMDWNDAPERTQAEVVAKLREAAAEARLAEGRGA